MGPFTDAQLKAYQNNLPFTTWFWESEKGFMRYPGLVSEMLEKSYRSKANMNIKVDDERFVDLEKMVQKRWDDKSKVPFILSYIFSGSKSSSR
jgi:hypothetical protein